MLKHLLVVLFIFKYIDEPEAEYIYETLRGQEVPEKIADIAYLIDETLGKYRREHPLVESEVSKPKFNIFEAFRKLTNEAKHIPSPGTSRQDIES
jgi:hypothetical protein